MMFMGADVFFIILTGYRMCWLAGPYGSGKTALSVAIASELVRRELADKVVSNIPIVGATSPPPVPLEDAAIIMDEAHAFMDKWDNVKKYMAFVRKRNLYFLMPSVFAPHPRIRSVVLRRSFNFFLFGVPFWWFDWSITNGHITEKGSFGIWQPNHVFGVYDTNAEPLDDAGIMDALKRTIGIQDDEQRQASIQGLASDFADAINTIPDAIPFQRPYYRRRY